MEEKLQLNTEVSRRYAKAFFEVVKEHSLEKKIYEEVLELLSVFEKNKEFRMLFNSPLLSSKKQIALVSNIFCTKDTKKIKVSKNVFAFFKALASNRRLKLLTEALAYFINLVKSMQKEVSVNLISSVPLKEDSVTKIVQMLSKKTDKKINMICTVDKSILGGIILQSGSNLIDTSIKNKLLKINNVIKGVN